MAVDIPALRGALVEIPGTLADDPPREPVWISQADPTLIFPARNPTILDSLPDNRPTRVSAAQDVRESERIAADVRSSGIEAIAWYRSFRVRSLPWGIFIRADGLVRSFEQMFDGLAAPRSIKLELALNAVLSHELAHFYVDTAIAQFELLSLRALWLPRKLGFAHAGSYDVYEEVIANASMLRAVRDLHGPLRISGRERLLREWTRRQPSGYSIGYRYTAAHRFDHALNRHGASYLAPRTRSAAARKHILLAPLIRAPMSAAAAVVPLYIVTSSSSSRFGDIGLFPALRIVAETPGFKKQLRKSPEQMQRAYAELRTRLMARSPTSGDRLKRWPPLGAETWSLRLNRGDRLHVRHLAGMDFEAVAIGSHAELGHD
ncbi:MAG: hypothetical protein EBS65_22005 [Betaproteobacteria bacterium]|nr:hypothetical protein [Betaproteobacteria bacterium]